MEKAKVGLGRFIGTAGLLCMIGVCGIASAEDNSNQNLGPGKVIIEATVPPKCKIESTEDVYVKYDPFYEEADQYIEYSQMKFNCNKGTEYSIQISNYSGKLQKTDGEEYLEYDLEPQYTEGTDSNGTERSNFITFTVYIPTGQNVPVGKYEETVNVNINIL